MNETAKGIALSINDISLTFGTGAQKTEALKNVSFQIESGMITGIMGPDAAGKTSLLRILAGLLVPDSGTFTIFNQSLLNLKKTRPGFIGYMPQRFGLYEDLSVEDNLKLYANLSGLEKAIREKRFERLLAFTGLAPFTKRLAGQLSGGMKQKLGIACALVGEPGLLLLDEPGVGVDPRSRLELWQMVSELADNGMTVLWATSYLDEAAKCPKLVILESGTVLFDGQPQKLAQKSANSVFEINSAMTGQGKREALLSFAAKPGIVDVSIAGDALRLQTGGQDAQNARRQLLEAGAIVCAPTLGDAYIAAVGGIDKKPSPYSGIGHVGGSKGKNSRIVADGLTKKFGSFTAAKNISFKVGAGEIVGLLGPNGAGKSTTFRMLCGLLRPSSGSCSVDGVDMLASGSEAREHLGYMAQKFSLYADISVWQNIYISARLYGLSKEYIKNMGSDMIQALGLDPYLKSRTASLPLGMKQRLALLCATLHRPPVLFLDEPTSGVDMKTRREFWKHISALTEAGTAVLVTTHFMDEAQYCDKIALIYRGEIIRYGSPEELRGKNHSMSEAFISLIDEYDRQHPL